MTIIILSIFAIMYFCKKSSLITTSEMNINKKIKVTYFFRKPQTQYHSIERVFDLIIQNLPEDIEPDIYKLKYGNRGIIPRFLKSVKIAEQ